MASTASLASSFDKSPRPGYSFNLSGVSGPNFIEEPCSETTDARRMDATYITRDLFLHNLLPSWERKKLLKVT